MDTITIRCTGLQEYYLIDMRRFLLGLSLIFLAACSSPPPEKPAAKTEPKSSPDATTTSKNPAAKFIELGGFRLLETSANKLKVTFNAVNHSDADLQQLDVHVRLYARSAKERRRTGG